MPFNLMDFISQIAHANQQSTQMPPVQAPQPQQPVADPMMAPAAQNMPGQNAMSGNSPFAQMMGAMQGKQDNHKGLFSALLKMFV